MFLVKKWQSLYILCLLSFGPMLFQSCSMLAPNRTFVDEMENDSDGLFVPGRDFAVVPGDTGKAYRSRTELYDRTPASSSKKQSYLKEIALQNELRRLEGLETEDSYAYYAKYKDKFSSDSERIYFLKLRSPEARVSYLQSKWPDVDVAAADSVGSGRFAGMTSEEKEAIRQRELLVGMSQTSVEQSWGRPARIDVAGNPKFKNERWSYYENGRLRQVFFESGKVQGWSFE